MKEIKKEFNPKQLKKILVSEDGENWCKRVFIYKECGVYYCLNDYTDGSGVAISEVDGIPAIHLFKWRYAKPLKKKK